MRPIGPVSDFDSNMPDGSFWHFASFRWAAKFGSYLGHCGRDATASAGSSPLLNFFGKKNSFLANQFQRSINEGRNVGPPQFVLPEAL
jgi:hypothetical protein